MNEKELVLASIEARKRAYVPYSHFAVGCALLTKDGEVIQGANIENAAYTPSNCAERTAFFTAVNKGIYDFEAIAICGGPAGEDISAFCAPCGVCRQVMREFCDPETFVILLPTNENEWKRYLLKDLLPESFGPDDLECTHH